MTSPSSADTIAAPDVVLGEGVRATRWPLPGVLRLAEALETERARWFNWTPVMLGVGIAIYFALPSEPHPALALVFLIALAGLALAVPRTTLTVVAVRVLLLATLGFTLITVRSILVAAPVLEERVGPVVVRGFIESIEPREGRGERVTIRVTDIASLPEDRRPYRVRIRTQADGAALSPGDAIAVTAHLAPPAGPVLPGGFDFARQAYFAGIGAVGYAVSQAVPDTTAGRLPLAFKLVAAVQRLRRAIGARVDAVLEGETAAIAKALVTGERGGIPEATNNAYRDSGLFHILSISGLHMAVMGGAVFWSVRLLLALFPSIALRYPVKKWAALAAAAGSLAYLAISGSSFATVRSFIMISIMFLAILLDRPAIALRNVAISALVILVLFPESLLDVGFQMSFAAVVALVAAYEGVRDHYAGPHQRDYSFLMKVLLFFGGIVLSTLVVSAAVTPLAIYHFHKSQQLAVIANLIAVPICNVIVMPAALATLVMMPFGLEAGPLWMMGHGVDAMSWTARKVAEMPGAVSVLPAIPTTAFALMVVGGLWLTLWHTRWRHLGLASIAAGLALAPFASRPDVLVGRDGELVAVRDKTGRLTALAAPRAQFELTRWLEHDGDARALTDVVGTGDLTCDALGCAAEVRGARIAIARHPAAIADDCSAADIFILATPAPRGCRHPAAVIDFFAAHTRGTHAIYIEGPRRLRIETVAGARGNRPWSRPQVWRRPSGPRPTANPPIVASSRNVATQPARRSEGSRLGQFAAPPDLLDTLRRPRPEIEDQPPISGDDGG